jgi:integrase
MDTVGVGPFDPASLRSQMLKAEKRHTAACKASEYDRNHTKCKCSYRAVGMLNGVFVRKALKTSNYDQAQKRIREMEATGAPEQRREPVKTEDAVASFMRDRCTQLQEPTQRKFRTLLVDRLQSYAASKGYRYLNQMTLDVIMEFRATWKDAPLTAQKNLERLRMFFRFAIDREWTGNNPAAKLKVKASNKEKDPLSAEEWERIKDAIPLYQDGHGRLGQANTEELRAFVLVLRHSGLRALATP